MSETKRPKQRRPGRRGPSRGGPIGAAATKHSDDQSGRGLRVVEDRSGQEPRAQGSERPRTKSGQRCASGCASHCPGAAMLDEG